MSRKAPRLEDLVTDPTFIAWVKQPSDASRALWQAWLLQHPEQQPLVEEARQLVLFLHFDAPQPTTTEFTDVRQRIREQIRIPSPVAVTRRSAKAVWAVAAVLVIVLTSLAVLWQFVSETTYQTAYGQTRTVVLPDQSTVVMNANSTLRYANQWRWGGKREVWLTGEAFFSVRKKRTNQTAMKFTVHTHGVDVDVLGTQFNVNHRRGRVKVVLASGQVTLHPPRDPAHSLVMQPGDLVETLPRSASFVRKRVNPDSYSAWRRDQLIFDETPVREIAQLLEDTYGFRTVIADAAIADRHFTGSLPRTDIEALTSIIAESLDLRIIRNKNTITFYTAS